MIKKEDKFRKEIFDSIVSDLVRISKLYNSSNKSDRDLIDVVNKKIIDGTYDIYEATMNLNRYDSETFQRLRKLIITNECYMKIRTFLVDNNQNLSKVIHKR